MLSGTYKKLVDPEKYQVFILQCPANIPLNFAHHTWFVCNEMGKVSRWEVLHFPNKSKDLGYLFLDYFPLFSGIRMFPFPSKYHWDSELLKQVDGDLAKRMIDYI